MGELSLYPRLNKKTDISKVISSSLTNKKQLIEDSDTIKKASRQYFSVQREPGPCSLGCYRKPATFETLTG